MSLKRIIVAGFGGQGVLLIGQMIAYAAMYGGKEVTWMPTYGPEMRGGTANCTVCVSDGPIASPVVAECDVLVAMNGPSLEKFGPMLAPGGDLYINTTVIKEKVDRDDVNVYYVDTTGIAEEVVGNGKTGNMVMLGAVLRKSEVVDIRMMDQVLEYKMTGKKAALIPANKKALTAWERK